MTDNRTLTLAKRIKQETQNKTLEWVKSSYANTYRLSLGSGMISLEKHFDMNNIPCYSFTVYNERNTAIDTLHADIDDTDNYNILKDIYELAEGLYLKTDETFNSMFDALNLPF